MMDSKFLKVAKEAALEIGEIISKSSTQGNVNIKNNDQSDIVTSTDFEAEEKIVEILTKNFPEHNILAEEKTKIDKKSEYTWVIDPLDGSLSFIKGIPYVAVLIGLLKNNEPIIGVIYHVSTKDLYWAESSKGAFLNGKPIHVGERNNLSSGVVAMDLGHKNTRSRKFENYVLPISREVGYVYSIGSSIPFGWVSTGILDAYIAEAWIWDLLAGAVIVREAGGRATDFKGNDLDWTKNRLEVVASNGIVHDQILETLR